MNLFPISRPVINVSNWGSYSEKIENGIDASIIFSIRLPTFKYKTLSTLIMVSFTWFVGEVLKNFLMESIQTINS